MYGCKLDEERLNNERIADVLRSNSECEKVASLISTKINIMKTNNINTPTWLLRFSSTPLIVYTTFKEFGFFKGLKTLYNYAHAYFYFWFIRNCKWYRNKLHKRLKNLCGEEGEILFDMMVDMPNCDPKKILNKYPKFR